MVNNNNNSNNLLISSFHDALAVLGDYAKEELLLILKRQHKIALSENGCSTKDEIEKALIVTLGLGGQVLVDLWNEKLEVAGSPSAPSSVNGSHIRR